MLEHGQVKETSPSKLWASNDQADINELPNTRSKHRKSWLVPACLSTQPNTMFVSFRAWGHIGKIVSEDLNAKVNLNR